uniref:Uncharacterized protein n=1 Tax=Glossina austeni TaxID=7395 RepID=A0A1A9UQT6_GLOAU
MTLQYSSSRAASILPKLPPASRIAPPPPPPLPAPLPNSPTWDIFRYLRWKENAAYIDPRITLQKGEKGVNKLKDSMGIVIRAAKADVNQLINASSSTI